MVIVILAGMTFLRMPHDQTDYHGQRIILVYTLE
jgi:hypothetical protein